VAVSSIGSQRTIPQYAGMGAAKGALETLTRYLAVEYGPLGIAVGHSKGLRRMAWPALARVGVLEEVRAVKIGQAVLVVREV